MHIGVLGTRGIPASYGGFESCTEQLSQWWAAWGHKLHRGRRGAFLADILAPTAGQPEILKRSSWNLTGSDQFVPPSRETATK